MCVLINFKTKRNIIIDYIMLSSSTTTSENHIKYYSVGNSKLQNSYPSYYILLNYEKFQKKLLRERNNKVNSVNTDIMALFIFTLKYNIMQCSYTVS